jgi:hypothetical protein
MLSLILISLAAPAAAPAQPPPRARFCEPKGVTYANRGGRATQPQRLGDLPPARHYLTVVRHVDGCPEPAVLRSGIGGR